MSLRNQSLVSEVQLNLDLAAEELSYEEDHSYEEDELLNLLCEILEEEFCHKPEDCLEVMEGNAIYCLDSTREIELRERYEAEQLNEGYPEVSELSLSELESLSQSYFESPKYYPLDEQEVMPNHVTGFIQIYSGEKFTASGEMQQVWKSIDKKVIVKVSDLMEPEALIVMMENTGIKWGSIFRVIFYGNPLVEVIGSRFYNSKESRELLPLTDQHPNILLALPDYEETEAYSESIFDWLEKEFDDAILYGTTPEISRVTSGHHELTAIRLEEVYLEEAEVRNQIGIMKRERISTTKKNEFIKTYSAARSFINGVNQGEVTIDKIYTLDLKTLEEILFLCSKSFERINDPLIYAQVKSYATKLKVNNFQATDSNALMVIQRINGGHPIEAHLLSLKDLEAIFGILWSNIGIRINPEHKEAYFDLKERLRLLRAKSRSPFQGKGR